MIVVIVFGKTTLRIEVLSLNAYFRGSLFIPALLPIEVTVAPLTLEGITIL